MTTRTLILREGQPPRHIELNPETAEALLALGALVMTRTDRPDLWEISAGTQVGVVSVDGFQILIQPKVTIDRLVFMMGYARQPDHWRPETVNLDHEASLPEALAFAFLAHARRALGQGLLKGYVTVDESLAVLRGRIREADQLRSHFGREIPLEVRYDDHTVDIPENQIILAAAEQLLRLPGVGRQYRGALQRLRVQLADVSRLPPGLRPRWTLSRLNARYRPALHLAEMILQCRSFEQRIGDLVVTGYLLNMARIFEDFVTVALSEAFRPLGGRSLLQYATFLDEAETVPVKPDYVWCDRGFTKVVVDAKYKAEKPSGFPQADLYQMLAYCTVLGLREGHLVYAKGYADDPTHVVRRAGIRIVAHTLDLDVQPAELLRQVGALQLAITRGADFRHPPSSGGPSSTSTITADSAR